MKAWFGWFLMASGLCCQMVWATPNQMTFQGTLKQNGVPIGAGITVNQTMTFRFVDALVGGNVIPGTPTSGYSMSVSIANGLFEVPLPLEPTVNWQAYSPYIEVSIGGQKLTPNQPVNANVYSMVAGNGVPPGAIMAYIGSTAPQGWFLCD